MVRRQFQDRIIDQELVVGIGLTAEHDRIAREIGPRQTDDVRIDPATAGLADQPVTEHIREFGERGPPQREIAGKQGFVGTDAARVGPFDAGRQLDPVVIAIDSEVHALSANEARQL